jgi:hypothetical protein
MVLRPTPSARQDGLAAESFDNASWHYSKIVRTWIREHNRMVKQKGKGVRILPFFLPTKSPWLNPIEPKWVHAKRNVIEQDGLLTAKQMAQPTGYAMRCNQASDMRDRS